MSAKIRCLVILAALSAIPLISTGCSPGADEQRGQDLFDLHCALCHEMPTPDLKKQPPKLEGLFKKATLPSGAPATDQQVRKTIIEGIGTMPAFDQRLTSKDLDDLVKYLHIMK
ncbi:MAG TPA: cytochrome c [Candidatus Acidoferrales bacterium]|nr:cytochrome c [Candidatus Acidoferrales bacterium]